MPAPASRHPLPTRGKPTKAANPSCRLPRRRQASASIHHSFPLLCYIKEPVSLPFPTLHQPFQLPLLPGHSRIHPLHELPTHLRIRRASPYFLQKCGTLQRIAPQVIREIHQRVKLVLPLCHAQFVHECFIFRQVTPELPFRLALRHLVATLHARRMSVAYRPHARRATVSRTRNPSNLFIASINELLAFIFPLFV